MSSWMLRCVLCGGAALAAWWVKPCLIGRVVVADPPPALVPLALDDLSDIDTRVALAEVLADADGPRLRQVAAKLFENLELDIRVWRTVFRCWMKVDPRDAWAFAKQHANSEFLTRDYDFRQTGEAGKLSELAIAEWAAIDPRAARAALGGPTTPEFATLVGAAMSCDVAYGFHLLDEMLTAGAPMPKGAPLPNGASRSALDWLQDDWIAALAHMNPQAALEWTKRIDLERFAGPLLFGWGESDPPAAHAWLDQQPHRGEILERVAQFMADDGHRYRPQVFDLVLAALPPGNDKSEHVQSILEALARVDPGRAVKECTRTMPDPGVRAEAIGKIAEIVAYDDSAQAWEILNQLDPAVTEIRRVSIPATEVIDHGETSELPGPFQYQQNLTSMRGLAAPGEMKAALLKEMMDTDKEQALRCLAPCPPSQLEVIGGDAIETWASHDPAEAAAWLANKVGDYRGELNFEQWFQYSNLETPALRTLAETLPPGTVRDTFAAWTAAKLAEVDPASAMEFARGPDGYGKAVEQVYQEWAGQDPQAALKHLADDSEAPPEAWSSVIAKSFLKDAGETTRVVESLPSGTARDAGLESLISAAKPTSTPQETAGWACDIGKESTRREALDKVLTQTSRDLRLARDENTAEDLHDIIDASDPMSDTEKQRWHERIDRELASP